MFSLPLSSLASLLVRNSRCANRRLHASLFGCSDISFVFCVLSSLEGLHRTIRRTSWYQDTRQLEPRDGTSYHIPLHIIQYIGYISYNIPNTTAICISKPITLVRSLTLITASQCWYHHFVAISQLISLPAMNGTTLSSPRDQLDCTGLPDTFLRTVFTSGAFLP